MLFCYLNRIKLSVSNILLNQKKKRGEKMAGTTLDNAFKKAEDALNKANLEFNKESTAMAGIGYAILVLARVLLEINKKE
jgi:hypothetical protein